MKTTIKFELEIEADDFLLTDANIAALAEVVCNSLEASATNEGLASLAVEDSLTTKISVSYSGQVLAVDSIQL